ncbi:MAG: DUF2851 family protein [Flavobacteriales bacterium]|nr:DUF2851 family protein [Flavobacteriales bacterium]MCB9447444.1 DUF2851 family protein [Flavobacteriales bacterium]
MVKQSFLYPKTTPPSVYDIPEVLIQIAWEWQIFKYPPRETSKGEPLQVVRPGKRQLNGGPDFSDSRLRLGDTLWVGPVEVHLRSSDWERHGHQYDPAYDHVILHVVYEHDKSVRTVSGRVPETVELKDLIPDAFWERARLLQKRGQGLPCAFAWPEMERIRLVSWLDRMLAERLVEKAAVLQKLAGQGSNWEDALYLMMARCMGLPVNGLPFQWLAGRVPLKLARKKRACLTTLEALYFGQAGLLPLTSEEVYVAQLVSEYRYLQAAHQLQPMQAHVWKFLRMRPASFPTLRISQFAALIHQSVSWLDMLLEATEPEPLLRQIRVNAASYWAHHSKFSTVCRKRTTRLGLATANIIMLNAFIPTLFAFASQNGDQGRKARAIHWMETLHPERNSITNVFSGMGFEPIHAGDSQALIHLHGTYCKAKKCLLCAIGQQIIRGTP